MAGASTHRRFRSVIGMRLTVTPSASCTSRMSKMDAGRLPVGGVPVSVIVVEAENWSGRARAKSGHVRW